MTVARRKLTLVDGAGTTPPGAPPPTGGDADAWRRRLTCNREGRTEGTLHNLALIIEHDEAFAGLFWLNESSNQILLTRDAPWVGGNQFEFTDSDAYEMTAWLQSPDRYGMSVDDKVVLKAVTIIARRHRRHPIRDYLLDLKWDGKPRVQRMLVDLFGAEDKLYSLQAAVCFAVGAVARVLWFDPQLPFVGAKVDFMLVFEDKQGRKKTTAVQTLFGAQWFVETMESLTNKDFYQVILGNWCVEIAEMHTFSRAEITSVKGAITRLKDKYRAPYDRVPREWRRECVFVGTTNENQYLRDHTGGRRFLPVRIVGDIDMARIVAERDQIWAEAVHLFTGGHQWWVLPDDAEEEQEARFVEDSWQPRIDRWLEGEAPDTDPKKARYPGRHFARKPLAWTTTDELLEYALGIEPGKHSQPDGARVARIMERLGWTHARVDVNAKGEKRRRERRWLRASGVVDDGEASGDDDPVPF